MRKLVLIIYILAVLLMVMSFLSCRAIREVEYISKTDTSYVCQIQIDTIYQQDSIIFREKGDTLIKEVFKYIYRVRERVDTIYRSKTDTAVVEVVKEHTKTIYRAKWSTIIIAFLFGFLIMIIMRKRPHG